MIINCLKIFFSRMVEENNEYYIVGKKDNEQQDLVKWNFSQYYSFMKQNEEILKQNYSYLQKSELIIQMFKQQNQTIDSLSLKVLQRNQELLFFFYKNFGKKLISWTLLQNDPNQIQSYIQSYEGFAKRFKICPNLIRLNELLILSISFHVEDHTKKILTFQQFNSFIFAIAKYAKEKYKDEILKDENEYLLDLIHFMQNNNLDKQTSYSTKNIILKIMRNNVLEKVKQNNPLVNHIDLIFNIFCNEFSKIGNPTLFMDKTKLYTMDCFAKHRLWIDRYPIDSDFQTFLSLINYVMQESNLDIENLEDLKKFIQNYNLDWECMFKINQNNQFKLQKQQQKTVKFLFQQNCSLNKKMSIMDYLLFCKNNKIIPSIIKNKNAMILFLSVKLQYMQSQKYGMEQILDQREWLTIDYQLFLQLLCILAEGFTKEILQISTEEKLRVFFEYFRIQLIFQKNYSKFGKLLKIIIQMKKNCFILLFFCILQNNTKIIQAEHNDTQKEDTNRELMQMMGNNFVAPPLVSPPPPIFSSGRLPVQSVYNLMHFPHQYSSPMVDYAYPTVFNPYYNHMLPYGLTSMFANPHIMSSLGMYGANPFTMSMLHNGFFGMVPYQNSQISGMNSINNSAQNWDHQDD